MTKGYIKLGGGGGGGGCRSSRQAPWAPRPALISSPAPQDCCSLILASLLSQQPWPRVPQASRTLAVTLAPGLGCSEPQVLPAPPRQGSPK